MLEPSSKTERLDVYNLFIAEAKDAFKKYRVLFLRGLLHPNCYEDLLVPEKTNFSNVEWLDDMRPPSNSFSVSEKLKEDEKRALAADIHVKVLSVIKEANDIYNYC